MKVTLVMVHGLDPHRLKMDQIQHKIALERDSPIASPQLDFPLKLA